MKTQKIIIIGATSAIAHETAKHFAKNHAHLYLVARNPEKLQTIKHDLQVQGATRVAGDRGRPSNYVYGTSKGAVSIFLQGLRSRLSKSGVTVLTIKPGLVDSPMTAELKKGPIFAQPSKVGKGIYKAIKKHKNVV